MIGWIIVYCVKTNVAMPGQQSSAFSAQYGTPMSTTSMPAVCPHYTTPPRHSFKSVLILTSRSDHTPANFFSFMEVFLGTICSCLPSLPALVRFVRQGGLTTIMSRLRSTINRTGTSGTSTAISKDPTGPGFKTQSSGTATSAAEGSADFFGDTIPWSGLPLRNGRVHPDQARFRDLSRQREWPLSSDLTPADARPSSSNERHVYIRTDVSVHQVARDEEEGRRETRLLPPVHVRAVNGAAVG